MSIVFHELRRMWITDLCFYGLAYPFYISALLVFSA
jgi:hypothetical protein